MNQISLASLMMDLNMRKSNEVDEGMVRHMILNSIRLYRTQFNKEYGEVILTYDSKHYWRREYFPNYKAGRRKGREKDIISYDPGDSNFKVTKELTEKQKNGLILIEKMMEEYGGTGVQQALNRLIYDIMNKITVFPVENETHWTDAKENVLPDAYLMSRGSTPKDLAYEVHTEIGDGYIYAIDARSNRRISENYELKEGDVIKIVSSAK